MNSLISIRPPATAPANCLGPSAILHMAFAGHDLAPLTNSLVARALASPVDPGATMDLATVLQTQGGALAVEGQAMMHQSVALQPDYRVSHGNGAGPVLLALVTAGDFMANTPVDFLLNGSDATLILHYVTADTPDLTLPAHDAAFLAVGQSTATMPVLANLTRLLARHHGPVLNNAAAMIGQLTRDHVSALLAGEPALLAPLTRRLPRADLTAGNLDYPVILRPTDSHAGHGLGLIRDAADLVAWLAATPCDTAFIAPFIDYRGADGLFAKYRVVLIDGRPFASHMATSSHWMVHYLNAEMTTHADRRAAEATWMETFDHIFAPRHAKAFQALHRVFGLDYFGIDCAETPDGRLLVFEVDTAMIVHDMDDATLFPYKKPAMKKLFNGFLALVSGAAKGG